MSVEARTSNAPPGPAESFRVTELYRARQGFRQEPWAFPIALRGRLVGLTQEQVNWETGPRLVGLYNLVRRFRPEIVVETGVWYGFTSAGILSALEANGHGRLISIDRPCTDPTGYVNGDGTRDPVHVEEVTDTGFVIPERLRARWTLHLGSSTELLADVLHDAGHADLFWHDSDHSYANMRWEYELAWSYLASGGVLASDDVCWNDAFLDFALEHRLTPHYWPWKYRVAREVFGSTLVYRGWARKP
jgi:Methyltransferase domain